MAYGMFGGVLPVDENPIVSTRRNSRTGSISVIGGAPRQGSIAQAHFQTAFMNEAVAEARAGLAEGGIPIGSVLVHNGRIVARGHNQRIQQNSVVLHAEMACLEAAGRQPASFYHDCTLYTTLSPCSMCAGAVRLYGIPRVVIGENKTFRGDEALLRGSNVQIDVLDSHECHEMMEKFIRENPLVWHEDIAQKEH